MRGQLAGAGEARVPSGSPCPGASPFALLFGSDSSPFLALQRQQLGVTGVGVTPSQVGVKAMSQHHMVGKVRVVEHELP